MTSIATGCTQYFADLNDALPMPPDLQDAPPRLLEASISPQQLVAGQETHIQVDIAFEDWNADVGVDQATVSRRIFPVEGNVSIDSRPRTLIVPMVTEGREGTVTYRVDIDVPPSAWGSLQLEVTLIDQQGLKSAPATFVLPID